MAKIRISKQPEERRTELISAARRLFDQRGVDQVRVSDIVRSVGVAQGTFYYHFHSKEQIVEAVVDEIIAELDGKIQRVLDGPGASLCSKLVGLIDLYLELIDQFTADDAHAISDFMASSSGKTPVRRARARLMAAIGRLVEAGAEAGQVQADHPGWTAYVLEAGLLWAATETLPSRDMLYGVIERALGLPRGGLGQAGESPRP